MTTIITGMSGFVGRHLARLLREKGETVEPLDVAAQCSLGKPVNLLDPDTVAEALACLQPDRIYHLAALSSVALSWKDPRQTFAVNVDGTRNLLAAVRQHAPSARVLMVSTAAVYGAAAEAGGTLHEDGEARPANPYAESKLAAERVGEEYLRQYGIDVRRVRPQGHTGPGQAKGFVVPDLASQIAGIAAGQAPPRIKVGNLHVRREFADVRDVVRAYQLVMEQGQPGLLCNLATNEPHSIREVAETLMEIAGVTAALVSDETKVRPQDESSPCLDVTRIQKLGFRFQVPFRQTLADVMAEWMGKSPA